MSVPILLSAGESSGEGYAAGLVRALRAHVPDVAPFGIGGDAMAAAGVELLAHVRETAVVGLAEVAARIPYFRGLKRRLRQQARERGVRVAVLVDFSGFNIRLGKSLKQDGVDVVWYVSPQVWAWRRYRARALARLSREILVVFPFEEAFYRELGVAATFVGHPLVDVPAPATSREELRAELSLPAETPLVALLPGSRTSEATRLSGPMAEAATILQARCGAAFVVPRAPGLPDAALAPLLHHRDVRVLPGRAREALAHADAAVVCSGTATLEAALLGAPMVVVYRMSPLTFAAVRRLVRVPFAAMPNLLLGRPVVPELLQARCTPEAIASAVERLLTDGAAREAMRASLASVREILGRGNAADRAAVRVAAAIQARARA